MKSFASSQIFLGGFYAEGVTFHSPESAAQPRHSGWEETSTLYAEGVRHFLFNAFGVKDWGDLLDPECASRLWALECNRFAVKTNG